MPFFNNTAHAILPGVDSTYKNSFKFLRISVSSFFSEAPKFCSVSIYILFNLSKASFVAFSSCLMSLY